MVLHALFLDQLTLAHFGHFWRINIAVVGGVFCGLGIVVARISNVVSYLSDSPETCINCHVMTNAYATWERGSHGKWTVCNDCHVPHESTVAKLAFKAMDGVKHSYVFTLRKEPQVLRLSSIAEHVVQANCIRCHEHQFQMARLGPVADRRCWDCHENIHGRVRSLSASPHVRRPRLPAAGFEWLKGLGRFEGASR